ncbi:TPA: hypothetical protein SK283_000082 [Yersinia enterocolitica]|nr:hypothetical protein [Yersinia enterocolitica]
MNFDRFQCQKFIESELGCTDHTRLKDFKAAFLAYTLTNDNLNIFIEKSKVDARDLFYKAALSFLEATYGIIKGHSSWAIVKLYYSIFYSLRVTLISSGYIILKNGTSDIYSLKMNVGSQPVKITNDKTKGDHKATIKAYKTLFQNIGIINTNSIDDTHVLDWIMEYRELVNYRINSFIEPDYGYDVIPRLHAPGASFDGAVKKYIDDEFKIYCFDKDHSMFATPLVLINDACDLLYNLCGGNILSEERILVLKNIINDMKLSDSVVLSDIFLRDGYEDQEEDSEEETN